MKQMKQKSRGFTMIELVIVVAILGILAAFALPRFANFSGKAQTAAESSVAGSLNAALGIVKAKFISDGSTGTTVDFDGNVATTNDLITVTASGDLDMTAVTTNAACTTLVDALLSNKHGLTVTAGAAGTCSIAGSGYSVTLSSTGATL